MLMLKNRQSDFVMTQEEQEERSREDALYGTTFKSLQEGSIVEGKITAVQSEVVLVDIGYKSEGVVPRGEFTPEDWGKVVVGDKISVYLEELEDADGNSCISKEKADSIKIWQNLDAVCKSGEPIEGKIVSKIKGGVIVDMGVKAFLPGSQVDIRPIRDLDGLIGKTFLVKVIKVDQRQGNVIVSRRLVLEEIRDKKRKLTLASLQDGQIVPGVVKNITDYGVFMDIGGIDGLLHITDMSWGRVGHPSEVFSVGEKVEVLILKYDKETGRVSLGYKQKTSDPWSNVDMLFPSGARVSGKVMGTTDYGIFVELVPGVEGLVHVSDMSRSYEGKHPSKSVSVGQAVQAVVLNVDKKSRKLSLGMKQIEPSPWELIEHRYAIGEKITGIVRSVADFGLFVGMGDGIDGLIHVSDISWTRTVRHPSEFFKKGQTIDAVILKIDREKERISLGYKQLFADPWEEEVIGKYKIGDKVTGKVTKITNFGVFLEITENMDGLIHITQVGMEPPPTQLEDIFQLGMEVSAEIVRIDRAERKIALSMNKAQKKGEAGESEGGAKSLKEEETSQPMRMDLPDRPDLFKTNIQLKNKKEKSPTSDS